MKTPDINKIAEHCAAILEEIGADLGSDGMRETPMRAAKALVEMTEGSRVGTEQLTKMFNVMHGVFQKDQNMRAELLMRLSQR